MTTSMFMYALAFLLSVPATIALAGEWLLRRKK